MTAVFVIKQKFTTKHHALIRGSGGGDSPNKRD